MKKSLFIILWITLHVARSLLAQEIQEGPYFLVQSSESNLRVFPLLKTKVYANILGPTADVKVEQWYRNDSNDPIDATYVFPASTKSAIYKLEMTIGERTIVADIEEKKKAAKSYQEAKEAGQHAALLEQHRPNVLQMNVANIMPGDEIMVSLHYNEYIVQENQEYQFVFPAVVGPRCPSKEAKEATHFADQPYSKSHPDLGELEIDIMLSVTSEISCLSSTTHKIQIQEIFDKISQVSLREDEGREGDRDFILRYCLSGESISEGVLKYSDGDEHYFVATLHPARITNDDDVVSREYIFVVDVSGSMHGFAIATAKTLIRNLIGEISPTDYFNLVLFAGDSRLLSKYSLSATSDNISKAVAMLDKTEAAGSTELLSAMRWAKELPKPCEEISRSVIVVTDGYINIEPMVFDYIQNNLGAINIFPFGIGSSVNRHLIEGMAHLGRGSAFIAENKKSALSLAKKFIKYVKNPVLTNINISTHNLEIYDVVPKHIPDLFTEKPIIIFGKYRNPGKGIIHISGRQAQGKYSRSLDFGREVEHNKHSAIKYLWAREAIREKQDYSGLSTNHQLVKEITDLGLKYNLLTKYTSFIAIDKTRIANPNGHAKMVKQPLSLPYQVSEYAIGFEAEITGKNHNTKTESSGLSPQVDIVCAHHTHADLETIKNTIKNVFLLWPIEWQELFVDKNVHLICSGEGKWNFNKNKWPDKSTLRIVFRHLTRLLSDSGINFSEGDYLSITVK